jgi:hypothetical protein
MTKRYVMTIFVFASVLFLSSSAAAYAEYRGTDLWSNITPVSDVGGLIDRYPLSHYQLDYHVDVTTLGVPNGDFLAGVGQMLISWVFFGAVVLMRIVIAIFDWSFNVDLVTGENGLLSASSPIAHQYYDQIVKPFLASALIVFGVWIVWKARQREHHEAGSALVRVIAMSVVSLAIIAHPQETIGRAYQMLDDISEQIVTVGQGRQHVSDRVFDIFVYKPFAVVEFGRLRVCTGKDVDSDGYPLASTVENPPKVCHSVLSKDRDDHGDYAARFLRYAPGSTERKAEYEAIRDGNAPDSHMVDAVTGSRSTQFDGVAIDRTDAPAVDLMQAGGTLQRLAFGVVAIVGMVGGALLLGLIAVAKLFIQIVIVMLFLGTPFMVLAALLPPAHGVFETWGAAIGKALVGGVVYSLLLAIVIATSTGLMALGGQSGYFIAFVGQTVLFVGVFRKRALIIAMLTSRKAAKRYSAHENHVVSTVATSATTALTAVSGGATTFASTMRQGWNMHHHSGSGGSGSGSSGASTPDSSSPPASAGRDYSPPGKPEPVANGHTADQSGASSKIAAHTNGHEGEETKMPSRSFREDLERARSQQHTPDQASEPASAPLHNGAVSASSFADDLQRAREVREQVPDPMPAGQERDPRDAA